MEQWNLVLNSIAKKITKASFETWLKSTFAEIKDETNIIVNAPNSFARDWLENHYYDLIRETLNEVTGIPYEIEIQVKKVSDYSYTSNEFNNDQMDELEELKQLVQKQSDLILKQQIHINDLEKRVTELEIKVFEN